MKRYTPDPTTKGCNTCLPCLAATVPKKPSHDSSSGFNSCWTDEFVFSLQKRCHNSPLSFVTVAYVETRARVDSGACGRTCFCMRTHIYRYRCIYIYIHTHIIIIHICMRTLGLNTCLDTYIHTYIHTCIDTYMHRCKHTYTCMHTYIHIYIYIYIHTCMHACIHTYTLHACMHACMHACIHTYIHDMT